MSEMVERVAVAIDGELHKFGMELANLTIGRVLARAAIEAMREPTEAMIVAGEDIAAVGARWRCMIDAALGKS